MGRASLDISLTLIRIIISCTHTHTHTTGKTQVSNSFMLVIVFGLCLHLLLSPLLGAPCWWSQKPAGWTWTCWESRCVSSCQWPGCICNYDRIKKIKNWVNISPYWNTNPHLKRKANHVWTYPRYQNGIRHPQPAHTARGMVALGWSATVCQNWAKSSHDTTSCQPRANWINQNQPEPGQIQPTRTEWTVAQISVNSSLFRLSSCAIIYLQCICEKKANKRHYFIFTC